MQRIVSSIILAAFMCSAAGEAQQVGTTHEMRQWPDLSSHTLSSHGTMAREADKDNWLYAESEHFIGYATTPKELDDMLTEAEFDYASVGRILKFEAYSGKAHIFMIHNKDTWAKLVEGLDNGDEGLALHYRDEIYLKAVDASEMRLDRIPHEVVHLRMRQLYGRDVPLWLDEGMACYIGWLATKDYAQQRGVALRRTLPSLTADRMIPLDQLTSLRSYPQDAHELAAYYREVEGLVIVIAHMIRQERLGLFVQEVCGKGRPWRKVLQKRFMFTDEDFAELETNFRLSIVKTP